MSNEDNSGCRDCKPGFRCTFGNGGKIEVQCPSNTYSIGGKKECTTCPKGGMASPGSSSCKKCPSGQVFIEFSSDGSLICNYCPDGKGLNEESGKCVACLPGTYSKDGLCEFCPDGQWHNDEGNGCIDCPAGQRCFVSDNGKAVETCPRNHFSPGASSTCERCPSNKVAAEGSSRCELCPPGTGYKKGRCVSCTSGRYSAPTGFCTSCEAGTVNTPDYAACRPCNAGYRCVKEAWKTVEEICPVNTYAQQGAEECSDCPPGGTSVPGSATCEKCPDGMGLSNNKCVLCQFGSISIDGLCTLCPDGKTSDTEKIKCIPCRAGYKCVDNSDKAGKVEIICDANEFSPGESSVCQRCPSGKVSDEGSSACQNCPVGFGYTTGYVCKACSKGRYSAATGFCISCESGEFSNDDKSACRPCRGGYKCEKGKYATTEVMCPENTFSEEGSSECTVCPNGETSAPGAIACSTCPPGTGLVSGVCTRCASGRYSSGGVCKLCGQGRFSTDDNTSCRPCEAGHKCVWGAGGQVEQKCAKFTYALSGSKECTDCPDGQISDVGASSCRFCPHGYGFKKDTTSRCQVCKPGQYAQGKDTDGWCKLCPDGKINNPDFKVRITK